MKSIKARPSGHKSQNHLNLRHGDTKDILRIFFWSSHPPLNMFCFGLLQTRGPKTSWISLTFLCSIFCTWTNVECWSYYYSNNTMNWEEARTWCREHYTDMVAIQNQAEISHLNSWLPKASSYYWIGIRRINKVWTWVGTNKALTPEAANWAIGEPNNLKSRKRSMASEDCVEMYIKRDSQAGKWNDERCGKSKTALCYTAACKKDLCGHGDCVETINSYECACFEGFYGEKCDQVVQCDAEEVTAPDKASVNCIHKYGNFCYDSMCHYSCEEGYQLSMSRPLTCTASTRWSEPPPTCELVRCPVLSSPAGGSMKCSDPLGPSGYRSTCAFACDEGYVLAGSTSNTLQCEASGIWNASQPLCLAVQCPSLLQPDNGFVSCGDDAGKHRYGNTCSFSCAAGYRLVGPSKVTCTSAAVWSERMPRCEEIGCPAPQIPTSGQITCSPSLSSLASTGTSHPLGTVCTFSCDEGHELHGALSMECANPGRWTSAPPNCKVVRCPVLSSPAGGSMKCSDPLGPSGYRSTCAFACDEGYVLAGSTSNTLQCEASGIWNASQPLCLAIGCPAPKIPTSGQITCSPSLSSLASTGTSHPLGTICTFSCDEGHELHGALSMECANPGRWTSAPPNCKVVRCPVLSSPAGGSMKCSDPLGPSGYRSTCAFACDEGYVLAGSTSNTLQCEASGIWNASQPLCLAIGCPAPKIPTSGQITCSPSLSSLASTGTSHPLGTVCTFSCDEGHELHGAFGMECANPGRWTSAPPNCKAVRCPSLEAPENGHINCSNSEPVFNSQCTFSCNQDYSLDGHELLTCDRHGEWTTGQKPTCQAPPSAVTAVASGVAAGGAMLSGLSLALWIMKRLKQKANKFELSSNSDIGESPQVYRNSITSLI